MVIGWSTTKTENGFGFTVRTTDYQKPCQTLKTIDGFKSRAIAKARAQKWTRYFKAQQKKGLL